MPATRSQRAPAAQRDGATAARNGHDDLVVEAPLEIRCNGETVATTMRTPGHDAELGVGFCIGEGYLSDTTLVSVDLEAATTAGSVDRVSIATATSPARLTPRLGTMSSSCGACGSTQLADMTSWLLPHLTDAAPMEAAVVSNVATAARAHQTLFDDTGGSHAAAIFERATGEVTVVREDIGRHNAVDKVIGATHLAATESPAGGQASPAGATGLWISGRASFEMMQKAWAAGVRTVISVSAVSALALEVAAAADIELIGFARGDRYTTYHRPSGAQ